MLDALNALATPLVACMYAIFIAHGLMFWALTKHQEYKETKHRSELTRELTLKAKQAKKTIIQFPEEDN